MRVLRSLLPMVFILVVTLGSPVLVSGCSNNPSSKRSPGRREQAGARAVARPDAEGLCEEAGHETQVSEVSGRRVSRPCGRLSRLRARTKWDESLGRVDNSWVNLRRLGNQLGGIPVERRGRHVMTPLEGNMASASKPLTVYLKQQRSPSRVRDGLLIHSGSRPVASS